MNSFPASLQNVSSGVIDAYVEATLDCSEEAILRSIEQYGSGRVEEHKGPFAPDAGTFASNVRMWVRALEVMAGMNKREQLVSYPIGALPPSTAEPLGPLSVDYGHGPIDLRGKPYAEKEAIMAAKGYVVDALPSDAPRPRFKRLLSAGDDDSGES
jgi:hypothetical protein